MGVRSAVVLLARHGVVPIVKGKGGFVARQTPESGAAWPADNRECTLWLEEWAL
jgi:DNA-binding FadR family transcriptional regulator